MRRILNVILDLTDRCNLRCIMCYFSAVDRLRFPPFDLDPGDGWMSPELFAHLADELFPHAWRVALGCAAEPLLHPRFAELLAVAARHRVPDLWFPTNLLALSRAKAEAVVANRVTTVAVSIDGFDAAAYERIRVGGSWERLLSRLELLSEVRRAAGAERPQLRLIFTWMRSNREELAHLPVFAEAHGFAEVDVRFVTPTTGVDVGPELLDGEDRGRLDAELEAVAHEAVARGLRLGSFPETPTRTGASRSPWTRLRRRLWRRRAGLDRAEHRRHARRERRHGCGYPGATLLVRPNGAVLPCPFWEEAPIALLPHDAFPEIAGSELLSDILAGLEGGRPIGTCVTCSERRDAFYRPHRLGQEAREQP